VSAVQFFVLCGVLIIAPQLDFRSAAIVAGLFAVLALVSFFVTFIPRRPLPLEKP
jgi:hypothetical protein